MSAHTVSTDGQRISFDGHFSNSYQQSHQNQQKKRLNSNEKPARTKESRMNQRKRSKENGAPPIFLTIAIIYVIALFSLFTANSNPELSNSPNVEKSGGNEPLGINTTRPWTIENAMKGIDEVFATTYKDQSTEISEEKGQQKKIRK